MVPMWTVDQHVDLGDAGRRDRRRPTMQARQIMTTPVLTVRPDTTVRDAATLLLEHQITAAPVLDAGDELIGIVSESDLVVHRFSHDPRNQLRPVEDEPSGPQTVGEVMTTPVIALGPSADAADLAQTMLGADVRSIPIVEGATVIGIVSRRDLLRTLVRDDDAIRSEVLHRIAAYRGPAGGWDVQVTDGAVLIIGNLDDDGRAAVALARTVPGVGSVHLAAQHAPAPS
jgi:CBS domain-containing protein